MINLLKQASGLFGAAVAAACCLGLPVILSALGAAGLGFLVQDALLFPFFVAAMAYALYNLHRSTLKHRQRNPLWLGAAGSLVGSGGLWLMVTGIAPMAPAVYVGLGMLVAASVWDFINGRNVEACANDACEVPATPSTPGSNLGKKAALGAAAAVAFYGMYKSVDVFVQTAEAGEIACWGANSCKGTTACTTAFNACTGMNACKGRGYIYLPSDECDERGGVPLTGSEGDPAKG